MKTELYVREGDASIIMTAENDFERETIHRVMERFPHHETEVTVNKRERSYRDDIESARVVISFSVPPPKPQYPPSMGGIGSGLMT